MTTYAHVFAVLSRALVLVLVLVLDVAAGRARACVKHAAWYVKCLRMANSPHVMGPGRYLVVTCGVVE